MSTRKALTLSVFIKDPTFFAVMGDCTYFDTHNNRNFYVMAKRIMS